MMELRRLRLRDSQGAAVPEFIVIAVGILIPLGYLIVAVSQVLAAQVAAHHAVREAGRVFVRDSAVLAGEWRAREAANIAFADRGLNLPAESVSFDCGTSRCLDPGSNVRVEVMWNMPLPWVPAPLSDLIDVPIHASQEFTVDSFRPAGV